MANGIHQGLSAKAVVCLSIGLLPQLIEKLLLFYESLLHSSGIIRSDRDRLLILGGYTPTMFQTWNGYEPDPDFAQAAPEEFRPLLTGSAKYGWERKLRRLETPASS